MKMKENEMILRWWNVVFWIIFRGVFIRNKSVKYKENAGNARETF